MSQLLPSGQSMYLIYLLAILALLVVLLSKVHDRHKKEKNKQEVVEYLKAGNKMEAVKTYKDFYKCSLSKAKTAIKEIEFELDYARTQNEKARIADAAVGDSDPQNVISILQIDGMEGHQFEYFCADLLRKNGFSEVSVTPGSGDQGVDILATKDGVKYAIQCKNYSSPLGNTPIQEVNAGKIFYNCHVAAVITNTTFTDGAVELAKATGVLLWGRNELERMISG